MESVGSPRSQSRHDAAIEIAEDEVQHVLPGWVNFVQEHLLLSFLLLAEAYLLGTLMSLGWVKDIEDPQHWGIYHGIGVVLFFLGGPEPLGSPSAPRWRVRPTSSGGSGSWPSTIKG